MTTTYAYRAEAQIDSDTFLEKVRAAGHPVTVTGTKEPSKLDLDLHVEFKTTASIENLLALAAGVVDGHILWRTLREGTLETCDLGEYVRIEP